MFFASNRFLFVVFQLVYVELYGVSVVKTLHVGREVLLVEQVFGTVGVARLALWKVEELLEALEEDMLRLKLTEVLIVVFLDRIVVDHRFDRGFAGLAFRVDGGITLQHLSV